MDGKERGKGVYGDKGKRQAVMLEARTAGTGKPFKRQAGWAPVTAAAMAATAAVAAWRVSSMATAAHKRGGGRNNGGPRRRRPPPLPYRRRIQTGKAPA